MATYDQGDLENKNQVVINAEDVSECEKFFDFFEIPKPAPLQAAFDAFRKDASFANQEELKFQLADVISNSEHAVFQDEVFAQIRPETRECRDELAFERQLEATLTSTTTES